MRLQETPTSYEEFFGFDPHSAYDPSFGTLSDADQFFRSEIKDRPHSYLFRSFPRSGRTVIYLDPSIVGFLIEHLHGSPVSVPTVSISPSLYNSVRDRAHEAFGAGQPEQEFELAVQMEPIETRALTFEITSRIVASPRPILDLLED